MSGFSKYLRLPKEVTPFEQNYLTKLNKIALWFFFANIPIFMLVAWAANTGPIFALVLSLALLIGPTIAQLTLDSERAKSMVHGFTAMGMGGLLVHFGQGQVQIEMHFYFFALLAMLSMFANPMVNIVAAITVSVHHLAFWYFLPSSVFNYDAPFWVVGVHAAFVVLETAAACFISRQFFDNVVGLEKKVQARTAEIEKRNNDMRLVLDNVGQGFLTIDLNGTMADEYSAIVTTWFGDIEGGTYLQDVLREKDPDFAAWMDLALESLQDGFLPTEVALSQLPKRIEIGDKTLNFDYQTIQDNAGNLEKILVIISDVTAELEREKAEVKQRQFLRIFEHIMKDKVGFLEFLTETDEFMDMVKNGEYYGLPHLKRIIHTIKGNASLFGMYDISTLCHNIESHIVAEGEAPTDYQLEELEAEWDNIRQQLNNLLGQREEENIEIDDRDYEQIISALLKNKDRDKIISMVRSWKLEPMERRLNFVKQQAQGLASRLGKQNVDIDIQADDIRIDSKYWAPFWSSFIHVLRNALDHGIEDGDERALSGKSECGSLTIETFTESDAFVVAISDDGRGISWDKVAEKARDQGIPCETKEDLIEAMFKDGITTKTEATEFSGRGIGMSAIREECIKRGGAMDVITNPGEGTKFLFRFPVDESVYINKDIA